MVVLASNQAGPDAIAVRGSNVYWTNDGLSSYDSISGYIIIPWSGSVATAPVNGGGPFYLASSPTPSSSSADALYGIAVDDQDVYWTDFNDGTTWKVPLDGGGLAPVVQLAASQFTIAGNHIYWTDRDDDSIRSMPLAGGPIATIALNADANSITSINRTVYWASFGDGGDTGFLVKMSIDDGGLETLASGENPGALAADSTNIYWVDFDLYADGGPNGMIKAAQADGSNIITVASGQRSPDAVTSDGVNLYWSNVDDGSIVKAPISGGTPQVLASGLNYPRYIATDGTNVYWASDDPGSSGSIDMIPVGGGSPTTIALAPSPTSLALFGGNLYWSTVPTLSSTFEAIYTEPTSGGTPTALVNPIVRPSSLLATTNYLYWSDDSEIMKYPFDGNRAVRLASGQGGPNIIAVDANNAYWTNGNDGTVVSEPLDGGAITTLASGQGSPNYVAINGDSVFWTDTLASQQGSVESVPLAGGTPTPVVTAQDSPIGIAVSATDVFWTSFDDGTVLRAPIAGGSATTIASGTVNPFAVATDGQYVYWIDGNANINKVAVDGGTPVVLATSPNVTWIPSLYGIAVDATSVYWTDHSNGTVMKLTPK